VAFGPFSFLPSLVRWNCLAPVSEYLKTTWLDHSPKSCTVPSFFRSEGPPSSQHFLSDHIWSNATCRTILYFVRGYETKKIPLLGKSTVKTQRFFGISWINEVDRLACLSRSMVFLTGEIERDIGLFLPCRLNYCCSCT